MVIKCPTCNHFVSDTVEVCPHCGKVIDGLRESSRNNEVQSELLRYFDKREDDFLSISLNTDESCCFIIANDHISISILSSRKERGDDSFLKSKRYYQRFKNSKYFSDFNIEVDNCDENEIELMTNEFTTEGRTRIENINAYYVELLINVFEITSLNQIQIDNSDASKPKGCFGILLLFVVCSLTASMFLLY